MNLDAMLAVCSWSVVPGWMHLVFAPRWKWTSRLILRGLLPSLLEIVYACLLLTHWPMKGGFATLDQVATLFQNRQALLAGWVHHLVLDLVAGAWEIAGSQPLGIGHGVVIPCLTLTFFFGPLGVLLYYALRLSMRRGAECAT
jgi:hypothetical protein